MSNMFLCKPFVWAVAAGSLLVLSQTGSGAQDAAPQALRALVADRLLTIQHWESQASLQIVLTIAVIVFGGLVTILQGMNRGWCKPATLALGAAVSIITGISTKVFPADYRALTKSAIQGRSVIRELNEILDRFDPSQTAENRLDLRAEFMKKYGEIDQIEKQLFARAPIEEHNGVVYASVVRKEPDWLANPPYDSRSLFFVGTGEDPSLSRASQLSMDDAVKKAARALSSKVAQTSAPPSSALLGFIRKSAQVDNTYFAYDREKSLYRYFTLVRLSRAIEGLDLASLISESPFKLRLQGVQPVSDGRRPLGNWRFECYVNDAKIAEIPPRNYDGRSPNVVMTMNTSGGSGWTTAALPSDGDADLRIVAYRARDRATVEGGARIPVNETAVNKPVQVKVGGGALGRGSFILTFAVSH